MRTVPRTIASSYFLSLFLFICIIICHLNQDESFESIAISIALGKYESDATSIFRLQSQPLFCLSLTSGLSLLVLLVWFCYNLDSFLHILGFRAWSYAPAILSHRKRFTTLHRGKIGTKVELVFTFVSLLVVRCAISVYKESDFFQGKRFSSR